jgi:uncharacterized protein YqeY
MLKEKMNADLKLAMMEKNALKRELLRVIKSEIAKRENTVEGIKELNDTDIERLMFSMIDNLNQIGSDDAKAEIEILRGYLPQQITKEEVISIFTSLIAEFGFAGKKDTGNLLKKFNEENSGKYDAKELGKIAGSLL